MSSVWGNNLADYQRRPSVPVKLERDEKACIHCHQTKPLSEFYPRLYRGPHAFTSRCRECLKAYQKHRRIKKKGA